MAGKPHVLPSASMQRQIAIIPRTIVIKHRRVLQDALDVMLD